VSVLGFDMSFDIGLVVGAGVRREEYGRV
jgi:hypothetical protein